MAGRAVGAAMKRAEILQFNVEKLGKEGNYYYALSAIYFIGGAWESAGDSMRELIFPEGHRIIVEFDKMGIAHLYREETEFQLPLDLEKKDGT